MPTPDIVGPAVSTALSNNNSSNITGMLTCLDKEDRRPPVIGAPVPGPEHVSGTSGKNCPGLAVQRSGEVCRISKRMRIAFSLHGDTNLRQHFSKWNDLQQLTDLASCRYQNGYNLPKQQKHCQHVTP